MQLPVRPRPRPTPSHAVHPSTRRPLSKPVRGFHVAWRQSPFSQSSISSPVSSKFNPVQPRFVRPFRPRPGPRPGPRNLNATKAYPSIPSRTRWANGTHYRCQSVLPPPLLSFFPIDHLYQHQTKTSFYCPETGFEIRTPLGTCERCDAAHDIIWQSVYFCPNTGYRLEPVQRTDRECLSCFQMHKPVTKRVFVCPVTGAEIKHPRESEANCPKCNRSHRDNSVLPAQAREVALSQS